jgi:hypothetical protein
MKKLYFLDEEEKNRILNIHESATKRQYLLKEDAITDFEDKLPAETKDKFFNMKLAWENSGTNERGIVTALNTFTPDEYNLYNQYLALKKPEGITSFEGMINSEMGTDNLDDVKNIVDALKKLKVTATFESPQGDPFSFKENSFKITSKPIVTGNVLNPTFTDTAMACIKQFSNNIKNSTTPGYAYVTLTDDSTLFFMTNYGVKYENKDKSIINGNWSCKGNILNVILTDGDSWSKAQGGWKKSTNKAAVVDTKKAYQERAKQVNQQTIDATKQIQQALGVETPSGALDSAEVETMINKLKQ